MARCAGTGTVGGATTVQSGGTLAPGTVRATLTFAAPVVMAPGSTLSLDIDGTGTGAGAGNYSRVVVTGAGNGFTAGGHAAACAARHHRGRDQCLHAVYRSAVRGRLGRGRRAGSFAGLAQPTGLAAGTRFDALYGPSSVSLVVTPASYGNLGAAGLPQTPNQVSVGQALDVLRPAVGLRMSGLSQSLFAPLYSLPAASIPQALDQLSPASRRHDAVGAPGLLRFSDQESQRLGTRRAAQGEAQGVAAAWRRCLRGTSQRRAPVGGRAARHDRLAVRLRSVVAGRDGRRAGFQSSLAAVMAGLDVELAPGFVTGVAGRRQRQHFAGNGAAALGSAFKPCSMASTPWDHCFSAARWPI